MKGFPLENSIFVVDEGNAYLKDVREKRDFTVVVKNPQPQSHTITVVILNNAQATNWDNIISQIKERYGDNLSSLLDSEENCL